MAEELEALEIALINPLPEPPNITYSQCIIACHNMGIFVISEALVGVLGGMGSCSFWWDKEWFL